MILLNLWHAFCPCSSATVTILSMLRGIMNLHSHEKSLNMKKKVITKILEWKVKATIQLLDLLYAEDKGEEETNWDFIFSGAHYADDNRLAQSWTLTPCLVLLVTSSWRAGITLLCLPGTSWRQAHWDLCLEGCSQDKTTLVHATAFAGSFCKSFSKEVGLMRWS